MIRISCCLLLVLSIVFDSDCQINNQDKKQILKILDGTFVELPVQARYPRSSSHPAISADTSETLKDDTTGIHYNNEYLLHRSAIQLIDQSEAFKLFRTNYVSVAEYEAFMTYARDSAAREALYISTESGDHNMLKIPKDTNILYEILCEGEYYPLYAPYQRDAKRFYFPLNWNYKLPDFRPHNLTSGQLSRYYLPSYERFYKNNNFDNRRLKYTYYETKNFNIDTTRYKLDFKCSGYMTFPKRTAIYPLVSIPLYADYFVWGKYSNDVKDEFAILAQVYDKIYNNAPMFGINGVQAKAFCHWKQTEIQREMDRKKLPYNVFVSLPTYEDVREMNQPEHQFLIPARNYTLQWQITVKDYDEFVSHVRDSIWREWIYASLKSNKKASRFIDYEKKYFHELRDEMIEIDHAERDNNRYLFSLNYKSKINLNDPEISKITQESDSYYGKLGICYQYEYIDVCLWNNKGSFKLESDYLDGHYKQLVWNSTNEAFFYNDYDRKQILGKVIKIDGENALGISNGVRAHENFQAFFIKEYVLVLNDKVIMELETKNPDDLIQSISYEQAMAFYHWKYPIQKLTAKSEWQNFVFPTMDQFEKIKKGETITSEEKKVSYPTASFRYVVHVYPK